MSESSASFTTSSTEEVRRGRICFTVDGQEHSFEGDVENVFMQNVVLAHVVACGPYVSLTNVSGHALNCRLETDRCVLNGAVQI